MTITSQQRDTESVPVARLAKWVPLAVILTGTFVYILDFFVVNVALPDIQRSLHASAAAIEAPPCWRRAWSRSCCRSPTAASYLLLALFLQQGRGLGALASGGVFAVLSRGCSCSAPARGCASRR